MSETFRVLPPEPSVLDRFFDLTRMMPDWAPLAILLAASIALAVIRRAERRRS